MSFTLAVDQGNPGAFYACCGLLELAYRRWSGVEACFRDKEFFIECEGSLADLVGDVVSASINSSLSDAELDRLGTLMSAKKTSLSNADVAEKERLGKKWREEEYLTLGGPFNLRLDWWWDDDAGIKGLKTWAAKQFVLRIARPLLGASKKVVADQSDPALALQVAIEVDGLPFYFDAANNGQSTPRDTGFGLYTLRDVIETGASTRPLLEFAAFVGLQRFRPSQPTTERIYRYCAWRRPLPISVAAAAASGLLAGADDPLYEFRTLARSEYMKAFLPAQLLRGVA